MYKNNFFLLVFLLAINWNHFSQKENEFSLIKTPEQKEKEDEESYLKFQDFFFKALKERAKENYDKAIEALDDCNQIQPENIAVDFEYAKNYYNLKQFDNASLFIEKTLKQKPEEFYVLEMAVKINRQSHNYDKAIFYQKKLVAKNPDQKNTLLYLYILNEKLDKARITYTSLEKEQLLDNRKDYFKRILFKTIAQKKTTKNSTENSLAFEKQQFNKEKSFQNLKTLLEKEKQLQNYNELVIDSSEGLLLFPAQPYVYLMNGLALNKLNRFNEAIESLENGLDYILEEDKKLQQKFFKQLVISYKGIGDRKNEKLYQNKLIK
ncbi:MAG TPA: hypothetical protein ENK67_07520 [Flavobacteriia bacterium]|nr:hypothetical protein [Flavobacteriia bacterium]